MSTISDAIYYPALITHLTGFSNYSWLHFCDGKKELIAKPLRFFEERLPAFLRIHKTALINPYYIQDYKPPLRSKMAGSVHLRGGTVLPVGRRRWGQIAESLPELSTAAAPAALTDSEGYLLNLPGEIFGESPFSGTSSQAFVVMGDELRALLLRQLVAEKWPQWTMLFFDTPLALKNALVESAKADLPALVILDGGKETGDILSVLRFIKSNSTFRAVPTLLTAPSGNISLIDKGHLLGANSVVPQPADYYQFMQVFEKVLRYWLYMVSAPRVTTLAE